MASYQKMASAIDYMVSHYQETPSLESLAETFSDTPTSFQKSFQSYVGITPKQLQRYMTMRHARELLLEGHSTLEAAYQSGLSGNARLHDLCVTIDSATPGELKSKGRGITVNYDWHHTPFGSALIGVTSRGICWLSFELEGEREASLAKLKDRLPNATYIQSHETTEESANKIRTLWRGESGKKIKLNLFGTNFQIQVWQSLLKIPKGASVHYGAIAEALDKPTASRAVGKAVGANPISYIIPCHRVIQKSGIIENYAWGSERKKVLLGLETKEKLLL